MKNVKIIKTTKRKIKRKTLNLTFSLHSPSHLLLRSSHFACSPFACGFTVFTSSSSLAVHLLGGIDSSSHKSSSPADLITRRRQETSSVAVAVPHSPKPYRRPCRRSQFETSPLAFIRSDVFFLFFFIFI